MMGESNNSAETEDEKIRREVDEWDGVSVSDANNHLLDSEFEAASFLFGCWAGRYRQLKAAGKGKGNADVDRLEDKIDNLRLSISDSIGTGNQDNPPAELLHLEFKVVLQAVKTLPLRERKSMFSDENYEELLARKVIYTGRRKDGSILSAERKLWVFPNHPLEDKVRHKL